MPLRTSIQDNWSLKYRKQPIIYVSLNYSKGKASFAIRTLLEPIEGKELGNGIDLWFEVEENIYTLINKFIKNGVQTTGRVIMTHFGEAFHVIDIDGYKLYFKETVPQ